MAHRFRLPLPPQAQIDYLSLLTAENPEQATIFVEACEERTQEVQLLSFFFLYSKLPERFCLFRDILNNLESDSGWTGRISDLFLLACDGTAPTVGASNSFHVAQTRGNYESCMRLIIMAAHRNIKAIERKAGTVITLGPEAEEYRKSVNEADRSYDTWLLLQECPFLRQIMAVDDRGQGSVEMNFLSGGRGIIRSGVIRGGGKRKKAGVNPSIDSLPITNAVQVPQLMKYGDYSLIVGSPQSGKSPMMHRLGLLHVVHQGISCMIVLMESVDQSEQMESGVDKFVKEHSDALRTKFPMEVLRCDKKFLYPETGTVDLQPYIDALSGKTPRLLVAICNQEQIGSMNRLIAENFVGRKPALITIWDEVDKIGARSKAAQNTDLDISLLYKDVKRQAAILADNSLTIYGITATGYDCLFAEERLECGRVFTMPCHKDYRGETHINWKHFEHADAYAINQGFGNQFEADKNIKEVYSHLSTCKPYNLDIPDANTGELKHTTHPIICLQRSSRQKEQHEQTFQWVQKESYMKKWAAIIHNENRKLYYNGLKGVESIELVTGVTSSSETDVAAGVHCFEGKQATVRALISKAIELGATHIMVISGDLANRGLNFVSNDYNFKLTHLYYVPSPNAMVAEMRQTVARICGIYKHDPYLPMVVYTFKKVHTQVMKGYWLQHDLIKTVQDSPCDQKVVTHMKSRKVNKCKPPQGKLSTEPKPFSLCADNETDGGMDTIHYIAKVEKNGDGYDGEENVEEVEDRSPNTNPVGLGSVEVPVDSWKWIGSSNLSGDMARIYPIIVEIIRTKYSLGEEVPRADIVAQVCAVTSITVNTVRGRLTDMFQRKGDSTVNRAEPGLWIKSENNKNSRVMIKLL